MNLIFLTMCQFNDLDVRNIYADLLNEFIAHGHKPYLISPVEAWQGLDTELSDRGEYVVLRIRVGNMSKVSLIEKGISTVLIENQFITAIKKHLSDVKFGIILYSTPPVTFAKVIRYLKQVQSAPTYLLLKDIFPQNAVDLGMFREGGAIHKYFRSKEKALYALSDHIGCMSEANVSYFLKHNSEIPAEKVHVSPNSILAHPVSIDSDTQNRIRDEYCIPKGAVVFMYGGNMGKPQDIPFVVRCLRKVSNRNEYFFVMCGTGSDYGVLEEYVIGEHPQNVLLINGLPKQKYDELLSACDIGLLFLDHRFTIPNFPSRMLSYMEQSMPILACTDPNTDIGKVIVDGGFGWWCESNDVEGFAVQCKQIANAKEQIPVMGSKGYDYLTQRYTSENSFITILDCLSRNIKGTAD